jgi:hypothetical protein
MQLLGPAQLTSEIAGLPLQSVTNPVAIRIGAVRIAAVRNGEAEPAVVEVRLGGRWPRRLSPPHITKEASNAG